MPVINDLDFGQDSAESEAQTLHQIFLSVPFYERLQSLKKWLILGRKGSGKTAACLMLFRQLQQEGKVTLLTPRSLSAAKSALLEKSSISKDEAALLKWRYIFLLEVSRYIVYLAEEHFGSNYSNWEKPIREVRAFLVKQDDNQASRFDKALKFVRSINKLAINILQVEGSIEVDSEIKKAEKLGDELDQVFISIREAARAVFKKPLYILVDQVDDLWDSTDVGQDLVIGLLRAAKETNDNLNFMKVIVFLRSDIFSYLRFHDSDKYRSHMETIAWNLQDLKGMIALRIRKSTRIQGDVDSVWLKVFPALINNKSSFQYLISHTLMRPRDLIQLCNICRDQASNRNGHSISDQDIQNAIPQYSQWKLEDLVSEYSTQFPFLENLILSVFYNYPASQFRRQEFEDAFEPVKQNFIERYGNAYFEPLDVTLQILYVVGFLGVIHNGKKSYESLGDKFILPYAAKFEIHPAFRRSLNISEINISNENNVFDQRGQIIGHQFNAAGSINFSYIQGRAEIIDQLRKLKSEMTKASESQAIDSEVITDLQYLIQKSIDQIQKAEPNKSAVLEYLTQARNWITTSAKVNNSIEIKDIEMKIVQMIKLVQTLF